MSDHTDDADETHLNISESADKIRVETQVKRGTGTRDQDTIKVKVKGNDPDDVVDRLNATVAKLHDTAARARAIQPESDD